VINASVTPAMLRDTIKYTPHILTSSQFFTFKMVQKWYVRISDGKNILMQHPMNSNSDFSASDHCSALGRPKLTLAIIGLTANTVPNPVLQ
jgi:hypothetical protein